MLLLGLFGISVATALAFSRLWQDRTSSAAISSFTAEVRKRLATDEARLGRELRLLVSNAGPKLTDALLKQAEKDMPALREATSREREILRQDLQERVARSLGEAFRAALARHEETLRREFPGAADATVRRRALENVALAMERLVRRYHVRDLGQELQTLYARWDSFPPAAVPAPGAEPLADQLAATAYELAIRKVAYDSTAPR